MILVQRKQGGEITTQIEKSKADKIAEVEQSLFSVVKEYEKNGHAEKAAALLEFIVHLEDDHMHIDENQIQLSRRR